MKKGLLVGLSVALLVGVATISAQTTLAASNKYAFTARGIVKQVDASNKQLTIYITHVSAKGESDLAGNTIVFNVKPAHIHKVVKGKQKSIKVNNVVVGDEVVLKGLAKDNDTFNLSSVVVNDRSFEVIGKLQGNDTNNHTLTIEVTTSTYKQVANVGKDVVMHYDDNTQFTSLGKGINSDEVNGNNQRVKVKGFVNNGNTWNVTSFWDNYTAKK